MTDEALFEEEEKKALNGLLWGWKYQIVERQTVAQSIIVWHKYISSALHRFIAVGAERGLASTLDTVGKQHSKYSSIFLQPFSFSFPL